jgi:replication-associated recombination protein RarA
MAAIMSIKHLLERFLFVANHSLLIYGKSASDRAEKARQLASGLSSHFDMTIVDCRETGGIEPTRKTLSTLTKPLNSTQTTVVFLESQHLTTEAQNFLLKRLEEPAETSQIVLTAPTVFSVLPTVASRCQKLDLGPGFTALTENERESFREISKGDLAFRLEASENLDLESWETFWREQMLEKLARRKVSEIVSYLRLIQRTKGFLNKRANPKLAKANLIFQVPILD